MVDQRTRDLLKDKKVFYVELVQRAYVLIAAGSPAEAEAAASKAVTHEWGATEVESTQYVLSLTKNFDLNDDVEVAGTGKLLNADPMETVSVRDALEVLGDGLPRG